MPKDTVRCLNELSDKIVFMESNIRPKADDEVWCLYQKINEFPKQNMYQLAKIIGWPAGKVREAVSKLQAEGLIEVEKAAQGGRTARLVKGTPWYEMLTSEEQSDIDKSEI
jgi:predicted transcriptional regulator